MWNVHLGEASARELASFCLRYKLDPRDVLPVLCESFLDGRHLHDRLNREGLVEDARKRARRRRKKGRAAEQVAHRLIVELDDVASDYLRTYLTGEGYQPSATEADPRDVASAAICFLLGDADTAGWSDVGCIEQATARRENLEAGEVAF